MYRAWDATAKGSTDEAAWNKQFAEYQDKYPKEAAELLRRFSGDLPENFDQLADEFIQTCVQKQKVSPHAKPAKTPSQHLHHTYLKSWAVQLTLQVQT